MTEHTFLVQAHSAELRLSDVEDAKADAVWMEAALQHGIDAVDFSQRDVQLFWKHMHFATSSVTEIGSWLPRLLDEWTSPRKVITLSSVQGQHSKPA